MMNLSSKTPQELENIILKRRPGSQLARAAILELIGREQCLQERAIHLLGIEPTASAPSASNATHISSDMPQEYRQRSRQRRYTFISDETPTITHGWFWNLLISLLGIILSSVILTVAGSQTTGLPITATGYMVSLSLSLYLISLSLFILSRSRSLFISLFSLTSLSLFLSLILFLSLSLYLISLSLFILYLIFLSLIFLSLSLFLIVKNEADILDEIRTLKTNIALNAGLVLGTLIWTLLF